MKKLNKKGFTLIELLAVIVILAILVAVAIPAVTRYLNTAREGTYQDNAQAAISVVRNDVISKFASASTKYYKLNSGSCTKKDGTNYVLTADTTEAACTTAGGVWNKDSVNDLLEKKLTTSPYGNNYDDSSYVLVELQSDGSYKYSICITDKSKGISTTEEGISASGSVRNIQICPEPAAEG